jgi:hypothetical protein
MTVVATGRAAAVPRLVIAGLALLAAALVLCGVALSEPTAPTRAVVYGSVALACYAAGLLCLAATRYRDLGLARWKLGSWILLWYGLSFGLATVTWSAPQTSVAAQITISSVLRALWLVAAGMTCWTVGYLVGPGHPLRRLAARGVDRLERRRTGTVCGPFTAWQLCAAGTAALVASAVTTGRFGYVGQVSSAVTAATGYGQLLSTLSLLAPLGLCTAALQVYREQLRGARLTLAILFLLELALGALAGGKENFIVAVLAVVIPMSAARYRLPKAAVIGGVLFFLVIVIPFNQAYRAAARNGSATLSASQAIGEAPTILRQTLTGHSVMTVLPNSLIYLLQRIREVDSPAVILQRTPAQIPFSSPVKLVEAPLVDIVPRAVWPGKPILATGYQFSQQYYSSPSTVYTSAAVTPIGDLFRHGGWIPVMVGLALLGCGVRLLDDVLDVRANPHASLLLLLLFPSVVGSEDDWVTLLAGLPAIFVVWLLAVTLAFRPRRGA